MTTTFSTLSGGLFERLKAYNDKREGDRMRTAAEREAFDELYGHIERRHRDVRILLTVLKILAAAIAGLLIAIGLNAWLCLIASAIVWRITSDVTERHDIEDTIRRGAAGVD